MVTRLHRIVQGGRSEVLGTVEISPQLADLASQVAPIQEATDLRDLFAALAQSVMRTLRLDACVVSLLDPERDVLIDFAASVEPPYQLNSLVEEFPLGEFPATSGVIATGTPLEVSASDPSADHRERAILKRMGCSRVLLSRLAVEGQSIGLVEAYRVHDRPFRRDDPRQIDLLVSFAANAYSRIKLAERLELHYTETIEALMNALEARDPATEAHTGRIRDLALAVAVALKVPPDVRRAVRLGAILHDVGKIGISDAILGKPGALTVEEWSAMRRHPEIGVRMLGGIDFLSDVLPVIRHHHEHWDGNGYPDGLAGEEIPVGARIVAVCDAFDAMTSDRPYRRAMSVEEAYAEILECSGTQFDPTCAAVMTEVIKSMGQQGHLEEKLVRFAS